MNPNQDHISRGHSAAPKTFTSSPASALRRAAAQPRARAARHGLALCSLLLLTATLPAQDRKAPDAVPARERKPADGAVRGERSAVPGAPRGERPAGTERRGGAEASRAEFPAEIKLTDDQQAKLKEINATFSTKQAELAKKRDGILTAEQTAAQTDVMKKVRDGSVSRQEAADLIAAAVKLTPEQKTQLDALQQEARQLGQESAAQKTAALTDEQRGTLRKLTAARGLSRIFSLPGSITVSDDQKAGVKALQEELGAKLAELTEKQALILTDERRTARENAFKEARASGKDRQAFAEAVAAAMKMSDAEKTQLAEVETSLAELHQTIRERLTALLTAEQKAELEKQGGARRSRN